MTFALFSVAMAWILASALFGLRAVDSHGRKAAFFSWLAGVSLHFAGVFALFTLVSAFADAFGALK